MRDSATAPAFAHRPWCQRNAHEATDAQVRREGCERGPCYSRPVQVSHHSAWLRGPEDGSEPTLQIDRPQQGLSLAEAAKFARGVARLVELASKTAASGVPAPRASRPQRSGRD